jgi:hypothetical protein
MIFGHAPVIFPAVLVLPPAFRVTFYRDVILLHVALPLRIGSDIMRWSVGRQWGSIKSALAVGLFLVITVSSFAVASKPKLAGHGGKPRIA